MNSISEITENQQYAGRAMPQAPEAEVYLLGGLIQDPNTLSEILPLLEEDNFSKKRHQIIWGVLRKLFETNTPIDFISLVNELEISGNLAAVGGKEYILRLIDSIPSAANAEYHADLVRKKSILRKLIESANHTIKSSLDPAADYSEVLQKAQAEIFALAEKGTRDSLKPISDVLPSLFEKIQSRKEGISGVKTGFTDLDELTSGLQKSDLIILAGRPGMGKTAFALTLAANAAVNYDQKVAFFSLEMSADQLVQRILSIRSEVKLYNIRTGKLSQDDLNKITWACETLKQAPLYIDDNSDLGISELMSKARKLKSTSGLDLIIVDYLQLMRTGKEENRAVAIGAISRGLKILAKDVGVPIIALAQLSRKAEEKGRERPLLSDLRESGSIEQDADMVWFVDRKAYRSKDEKDKNSAQLLVAKHRNGSVDDIDMIFQPEFTAFYNAEKSFGDGGFDSGYNTTDNYMNYPDMQDDLNDY